MHVEYTTKCGEMSWNNETSQKLSSKISGGEGLSKPLVGRERHLVDVSLAGYTSRHSCKLILNIRVCDLHAGENRGDRRCVSRRWTSVWVL